MEQLNKIELRGTVGIVRIKSFEGRQMARFSLATNFAYFDRNNEGVIETSWHNIIVWEGKDMPDLNKIEKGATVYVCGRLRIQKYTAWRTKWSLKRTKPKSNSVPKPLRPCVRISSSCRSWPAYSSRVVHPGEKSVRFGADRLPLPSRFPGSRVSFRKSIPPNCSGTR